jgi:hypothetical protein
MAKITLHIFIFLLLPFAMSEGQSIDSTKWINAADDSIGISFVYPSYFTFNTSEHSWRTKNVAYLEYLRYSPEEVRVNPTEIIYLELYSTLKIYPSDLDFDKIAKENNFFKKNDKWFDNENPYGEPSDTFNLSSWKGLSSTRRASIGIKGGGTWTSAADKEVLLLIKDVGNSKSIICYAEGFDFPNAKEVLEKICNSIIFVHR